MKIRPLFKRSKSRRYQPALRLGAYCLAGMGPTQTQTAGATIWCSLRTPSPRNYCPRSHPSDSRAARQGGRSVACAPAAGPTLRKQSGQYPNHASAIQIMPALPRLLAHARVVVSKRLVRIRTIPRNRRGAPAEMSLTRYERMIGAPRIKCQSVSIESRRRRPCGRDARRLRSGLRSYRRRR